MQIQDIRSDQISEAAALLKAYSGDAWSEQSIRESFETKNYIICVAVVEDKLVGYCAMYTVLNEGSITNIVVSKNYREQGIATNMINFLLKKAIQKKINNITLEVRQSNEKAIKFYEKCGFKTEGLRSDYYEKPTENALIMWKRNISTTK